MINTTAVEPNFMIIGMQKSGTSWLSTILRQHPDIFLAERKELHFFNRTQNFEKGIEWYRSQFSGYNGERAVGEATPNYLWNCPNKQEITERGVIPDIAKIVHGYFPNLKLIVALREPRSRSISAYYHFIRSRRISPGSSILEAGQTNGIITMGFYRRYIEEWLKLYPIKNFLFLIYESDIVKNKERTLARVFKFLEADDTFKAKDLDQRVNARNGHLQMRLNYISPPASTLFFKFFPFLRSVNYPPIRIDPQELEELQRIYTIENAGLDDLIGRKLPW